MDGAERRERRWPSISRDTVLFIAGLAGLVHETLSTGVERPILIAAFLAMMGLPLFLRADERGGR
jgi:hypothetical protein